MSAFQYNYPGFLTRDVMDSITDMGRRYPFPVEVKAMPEHRQMEALFEHESYVVHGEGCMGEPTRSERKGVPYGFVHRDFMSDGVTEGFFFLPSQQAHDMFVKAFPDLVISANPFTSSFGEES